MNGNYDGCVLAYAGDAVIELLVRERLISRGNADTGKMSAEAQKIVCAASQSEKTDALLPLLTEDECAAYRLGRNHKVNGKPKRASAVEYHRATGFEAVFGYLYLTGRTDRIKILFDEIYGEI